MLINHVRQRLEAGEPSIGTWLSLPSPEAAEYVSGLGLDWLVVDTEHNAIDIRTLAQMFIGMSKAGIAPMVRIPWNTPEHFKRVLDAGAWGIVVPMVNSREEAEGAVRAARYYPDGNRSVGGGRHAISFGSAAKDYYGNANKQTLLVLQIEHIDGVNNIAEICDVPGFNAVFIGPNDLAASMGMGLGVPLESEDQRLVDAIMHVRDTCRAKGIPCGVHTSGAEAVNMRIAQGFQFCAMASELKYLLGGLAADAAALNWAPSERGSHVGIDQAAEQGAVVRY